MNKYELTLVLPGEITPAKKKSFLEKVENIVKTGEGKIKKTDDWGKIDLAYNIKKESTGAFIYMELELNGKTVNNLKDKLRMDDGIIRYLLVRTSK